MASISAGPSNSAEAPHSHIGTVAAPLFGGFSITLIGVVAQAADHFRLASIALAVLVVGSLLFAECVVAMYWVKEFSSRSEDVPLAQLWLRRLAWAYDAAQCALFLGIAIMMVPQHGDKMRGLRWVAAGIALSALLRQVTWIALRGYEREQVLALRGPRRLLVWLSADPTLRRRCRSRGAMNGVRTSSGDHGRCPARASFAWKSAPGRADGVTDSIRRSS